MNRRLILPLLICGLTLAGCYRQAGDSFEQVDSQSVESIASPTTRMEPTETEIEDTSAQNTDATPTEATSGVLPSKTTDPNEVEPTDVPLTTPTLGIPPTNEVPIVPTATSPTFLTPEAAPPQVEQPTVIVPTATPTFDIVQPSATSVEDAFEAGDECVREVVSGDTLFRIALNNGTTVEAIQELNSLESDAIQVGQLLRIPGCVPGQADEPTATRQTQAGVQPTATSSVGGSSVATVEPAVNIPTGGQQIHVVVSGETLGAIANRYGTTIAAIVELNNMTNPDALSVGDELLIPAQN
jgi:LysM repeat protein